jgi:exo-beta-1,3-glucanase (GH17 family)
MSVNSFIRIPLGLFALTAAAIVGFWGWLSAPVPMPAAPIGAAEKLYCVSYAPLRAEQNTLGPGTPVEPWQIDEDLAQLKQVTNCVRTYSIDHGLDRVAEIAQRHGLKVMQGLWLSSNAEKSRQEVETTVALAKRYPDVIRAVVVGNEVLLRGEMSPTDLANTIRGVKAQVAVPVTYADVWEFWLRHRELVPLVDFVTIHILPYWEDFPIAAEQAAPHVLAISRKVAAAFPGKEIVIGETGWPSAGRMREGALPSAVNQARVMHQVLALAKRENYRVNLIEAFDQPWKRALEGTVGGHWGVYDADTRAAKFAWGGAVSNHPHWPWQAAGGVAFAALIFAAAFQAGGRQAKAPSVWAGVALIATIGGAMLGWAVANVPVESFDLGGWLRNGLTVAAALAAPPLAAAALAAGMPIPAFARVLGRAEDRPRHPLALATGAVLVIAAVVAVQAALGLVFDPRYRDFPFAPLSAATLPFLLLSLRAPRLAGRRGPAEIAVAAVLGLSLVYIAFNESFANWQAIWFCAVLLALGVTLLRLRDAPG